MSKPFKTILCADFETRWSSKPTEWSEDPFTLSKLTTEEYIRSPLFHAFGLCLHEVGSESPTQWYSHEELPRILKMYDWSTTAILCHNSQFDAAILSYIYGIKPCFIFDTLSMGRALRGVEVGNSLMKLAEDYGLPPKGRAVHSTDGLWTLPVHIERELAEYCKHDVFLCEQIFMKLLYRIDPLTGESAGEFPKKELRLIDMTMRMYTDPVLVLDKPMLEQALVEEKAKLAAALERTGVAEASLASNDQFADVLRTMGVVPPTKISKTTGKETFAFAKNDALFQALLNGDNEDVALLCEARLKVKSTLERTRAQRFIDIAKRGALPVPLAYYGAATGRWSAAKGGSTNLQNMKRGSFLRRAITAPAGYVICAGDLAQIEPRVLAWLAEYEDMLALFRSGTDVYAAFGERMFGVPGLNKTEHPLLRQSSKSALLGCGFQLGAFSFAAQLLVGFLGAPPLRYTKADARQLGVTAQDVQKFMSWDDNLKSMQEIPHTCTEEELLIHCLATKAIVNKYREAAHPVVSFWSLLGNLLERSLVGGEEYNHKDVLLFRKGEIIMTNGMALRYPDLKAHIDPEDKKKRVVYTYADGKKRVKLYPGKICNNVTQGTARIVMTEGMLLAAKEYRPLFTVHDEFGIMVPEEEAAYAAAFVKTCMTTVPKWIPGLPLESEVSYAKRYGDCK